MPSKALLRPVELDARGRSAFPGSRSGRSTSPAVLARRDEVIHNLDDSGQLPWLEERGVTLVRGRGRLDGERRVVVGDEELVARKAVIVATGLGGADPRHRRAARGATVDEHRGDDGEARCRSGSPSSAAASSVSSWRRPGRRFGSKVTLVHRGDRLIEREEPFAGAQVLDALERVRRRRPARSVRRRRVTRTGAVAIELDDGRRSRPTRCSPRSAGARRPAGSASRRSGSQPTGRSPSTTTCACRAIDWLYAIGDVNGRVLLTHMGKYQGRLAADVILGPPGRAALGRRPLAARDLHRPAGRRGRAHARRGPRRRAWTSAHVDVETSGNAGGSFVGRGAPGTSRIVVDEDRRVIVGATITGSEVAEALHAATIAVIAEVSLDDLWHAVPSFPTRSELWLKLLEAYGL